MNVWHQFRFVALWTGLSVGLVQAQEEWSFPAGSSPEIVERMVTLAGLRDNDVVVDLGSYDGRIVLAAVRRHPKVRGWGVDIDASWVEKANEAARRLGVADRAHFLHRNAFDADLREVTVINMWLFRSLTRLLRPKILAEARPGTRVIANGAMIDNTDMLGHWQPDQVDYGADSESPIFLWIVPARVEGAWTWELPLKGGRQSCELLLAQQFQRIEGQARLGNRRESIFEATLRGTEISFGMEITVDGIGRTVQRFAGRVDGDRITGTVAVTAPDGSVQKLPWNARKSDGAAWFRPTGVELP